MSRVTTLLWLAAALLCAACDVHEFPGEAQPDASGGVKRPLELRLDFNIDLPIHTEMEYSRAAGSTADADMRYIIAAYHSDKADDFGRTADTVAVVTRPADGGMDISTTFRLREGYWRFLVWADYVDAGTMADKYYDTSDFSEIVLADRAIHTGCDDRRDAFRGVADVRLHDGVAPQTVTVEMRRPLAKFTFVSTDLDEFIRREMARAAAQAGDAPSQLPIDLGEYSVRFFYTGYMNCSFNMFTDKPANAWTGVNFEGRIRRVSDTEAELGFDYVFVNGQETSVAVAVQIYGSGGELIAASATIDVPISRSKETVVRGDFFTAQATGGVGISPGFDGPDYNIEIK